MKFTWIEKPDGDWTLDTDTDFTGLVCIHHEGYVMRVWDGGLHQGIDKTVEDAKRTMEHSARADAAAEQARSSYWSKNAKVR